MFRTFRGSRKSHASLLICAWNRAKPIGSSLGFVLFGAHLHVRNSCRLDWFRWPVLNECVIARTTRRSQKRDRSLQESTSRSDSRDVSLYRVSPRPDWVHWDGIEYWDSTRRHGIVCQRIENVSNPFPWLGFVVAAQGKLVTFGVTRGCIEVDSPVSSITWLIAP